MGNNTMEPWERVERKVDRLTWLVVGYLIFKLAVMLMDWWSTIFWSILLVGAVYVLLLTPAMRAIFPNVGRRILAVNRWVFQKAMRSF